MSIAGKLNSDIAANSTKVGKGHSQYEKQIHGQDFGKKKIMKK